MHGQRSSHHALLLRSRLRERCLLIGVLLGLPVATFVVVSLAVVALKAIVIVAASLRLCLVIVRMMHTPKGGAGGESRWWCSMSWVAVFS